MTSNPFNRATKEKAFLRLALIGISGGGKTYSALNIAQHLVPGGKVALIDTEHGSASKYADLFTFDTVGLPDFTPKSYVAMIKAAAANGYDVVIIDSLTHAWDSLLAMKDKEAMKPKQNSFTAWGVVNKHYDSLIEAIVGTPIHIIGTIRSKSDYIMEEYTDSKNKVRTKPVKVGMKAIQRDGFEYEFDVVAQMDIENRFIVEKTRCTALSGVVIEKPGKEVADVLRVWVSDGVEPIPDIPDVDEHGEVEQPSPAPRQQSAPDPSELDAHLSGPEPDTRAVELARSTFPFNDADKNVQWQRYIDSHAKWNVTIWAAAKNALKLIEGDVHDALEVASLKDWGVPTGTVARLWLTLCEERIALDDIAEQANES